MLHVYSRFKPVEGYCRYDIIPMIRQISLEEVPEVSNVPKDIKQQDILQRRILICGKNLEILR